MNSPCELIDSLWVDDIRCSYKDKAIEVIESQFERGDIDHREYIDLLTVVEIFFKNEAI